MSEISELLEEEDDSQEEKQFERKQRYKIFRKETLDEEIVLLNFSEHSGYFPDYTAERLKSEGGTELWEVNTEERSVEEVSIESDYGGRHELASKLQAAYEENLD
ncbi:MAG: hypothetical protein ABEK10_04625 [Candidatus Nanosalina sp.]